MKADKTRTRFNQRGFSLAEILVATAIFTIIMVAALMIYDQSQQVFKTSMESADTQQNVRVAFDKLVSDLRMAGYDYDRDGIPTGQAGSTWALNTIYKVGKMVNPTVPNGLSYRVQTEGTSGGVEPVWPTTAGDTVTDGTVTWETMEGTNQYQQPDEQIEYAGPTAVAVRANFDFQNDAANENGREEDYESGPFPLVTTANDEIVAYALVSVNGANDDTMTLFADTSVPRDAYPGGGGEETLDIEGVDLDPEQKNAPYRLFRFTWDDDGELVRQPLAENIRNLRFEYYQDGVGQTPLKDLDEADVLDGTGVEGLGAYDPDDPMTIVPQRVIRTRIRSVRVRLIGMNETETADYVDPYEPSPDDPDPLVAAQAAANYDEVKRFKKYRLESLVAPRNVGRRGMREQDVTEPGVPILKNLCFGHCGIAYLEWQAPSVGPGAGAVEQFAILFDTDNTAGFASMTQVGQNTSGYVYGLDPTLTYYFKVSAINSYGANVSAETLSGIPKNATQPMPPTDVVATAGDGKIVLTWQRPTKNVDGVDALTCSDGSTPVQAMPQQEIKGYRIYRSLSKDFVPGGADSVLVTGTPTLNNATGQVTFDDTTAAGCVDYYYRVQTMDYCEDDAAKNESGVTGISDFSPSSDPVEDAVLGRFDTTGTPEAPSDLTINPAMSCTGNLCDVTLTWPKVVLDVDTPPKTIAVDKYIVRRQKTKGGTDVGGPEDFEALGQSQTAGNIATYVNEDVERTDPGDGASYLYKYTVVAVLCDVEGDVSPERIWPCTFDGGNINVSVDPTPFDGTGLTASAPWLAQLPSDVTVTMDNAVKSINVTIYDAADAEVATYGQDDGSTFTDFTFNLDATSNGETYRIEISVLDNIGCASAATRYISDSPTAGCLIPFAFDNSVIGITAGQTFMKIRMVNQCDDPITITRLKFEWQRTLLSSSTGGTRLDRIHFPLPLEGGGDPLILQDRNDASGVVTITTFPLTALMVVPPLSSSYVIKVTFDRSVTSTSPIRDFCVSYDRNAIAESPVMIIDSAAVAMSCP